MLINVLKYHGLSPTHYQARINLGQLAKRAHINKDYFILEKDGIPVIGIMDADELEDYRAGRSRPAEEFLAELRQEMRTRTKLKICGLRREETYK